MAHVSASAGQSLGGRDAWLFKLEEQQPTGTFVFMERSMNQVHNDYNFTINELNLTIIFQLFTCFY